MCWSGHCHEGTCQTKEEEEDKPGKKLGEDCNSTSVCEESLSCSTFGKKCHVPLKVNETCGPEEWCANDLYCNGYTMKCEEDEMKTKITMSKGSSTKSSD